MNDYVSPDSMRTYPDTFNIKPQGYIYFKGDPGYETYALDQYTIGVKPKWISIENKLPPRDTPVLCFYSDNCMDVMEYWYDDEITGKAQFFRPPAPPEDNVTHWMELPNPPEKE